MNKRKLSLERFWQSYATLMTLLFALFVLLYSASTKDPKVIEKLVESIKEVIVTKEVPSNIPNEAVPNPKSSKDSGIENLIGELKNNNFSHQFDLSETEEGLVLKFNIDGYFDEAIPDIHEDVLPLFIEVGKIIQQSDRNIRIEAHTDPSESAQRYGTHFGLGAKRAENLARIWVDRLKFSSDRIAILSHGFSRPIQSNDSEWGRSSNRRVEVIVLK